jgi:hypothetical protein
MNTCDEATTETKYSIKLSVEIKIFFSLGIHSHMQRDSTDARQIQPSPQSARHKQRRHYGSIDGEITVDAAWLDCANIHVDMC